MRNRNVLNSIKSTVTGINQGENGITGIEFLVDSADDLKWTVESIRKAGFKCRELNGEFVEIELDDLEGYEEHLKSIA